MESIIVDATIWKAGVESSQLPPTVTHPTNDANMPETIPNVVYIHFKRSYQYIAKNHVVPSISIFRCDKHYSQHVFVQ